MLNVTSLYAQYTFVLFDLEDPTAMVSDENHIYVAESTFSGTRIFAYPESPIVFNIIGGNRIGSMSRMGNDLYFAARNTVHKIDITDPNSTPVEVVINLDFQINITSIALRGNDLYLGTSLYASLYKISKRDITDPNSTLIDVVTLQDAAHFFKFYENELYFKYGAGTLSKIDITDPTPILTDVITLPDNYIGSMAINGNQLYMGTDKNNSATISQLDLTDSNPTLVDLIDNLYTVPNSMDVLGEYLYMTHNSPNNDHLLAKLRLPPLSVHENMKDEDIYLYPNPSENILIIKGLNKNEFYTIYNILGEALIARSTSNSEEIDVKNLSNGLYFLKLDSGKTFQFIKK